MSGGAAAHPHTSELGLQAADLAGDRTHPAHTHTHTSGGRCDHSRTQAADHLQVSNQPQANLCKHTDFLITGLCGSVSQGRFSRKSMLDLIEIV